MSKTDQYFKFFSLLSLLQDSFDNPKSSSHSISLLKKPVSNCSFNVRTNQRVNLENLRYITLSEFGMITSWLLSNLSKMQRLSLNLQSTIVLREFIARLGDHWREKLEEQFEMNKFNIKILNLQDKCINTIKNLIQKIQQNYRYCCLFLIQINL